MNQRGIFQHQQMQNMFTNANGYVERHKHREEQVQKQKAFQMQRQKVMGMQRQKVMGAQRQKVMGMQRQNVMAIQKNIDMTEVYKKSEYFIINNNLVGGSNKWVNDISNNLGHELVRLYKENQLEHMLTVNSNKNIVIIINSFLFTDITMEAILKYHDTYKFKIIIPIHDWFWFCLGHTMLIHNIYLNSNIRLEGNVLNLFNRCYKIICPTKFVYNIIKKYYNNDNLIYNDWIDYDLTTPYTKIKVEKGNKVNIGIFVDSSEYKGVEHYNYLINKYKHHIGFFGVGRNIEKYADNMHSFMGLIKKYNIHGLLYLNKWGETWCYGLTKGLLSGLPLLYNNVGAFKERIPKDNPKYIINNNNENEFYNYKMLEINFNKFINYIKHNDILINNEKTFRINNTELINKIKKNKLKKNKLKKYAIYFPQFHKIKENDINFYEGYTDILNLKNLDVVRKETPNKNILNLKTIENYDLVNNNELISRQIDLLEKYDIDGFAMYYYWFSENTITNKNKIMYNIHKKMLSSNLKGKKIFFVWANENWSDNPAFGSSNNIIKNSYDKESFIKHANDLINSFKHDNYLKINNKPVFYIHHPWVIDKESLTFFINTLSNTCKNNGFSGVDIKLNNMNKDYSSDSYEFHPNYKKTKTIKNINGKTILDYNNYVNLEVNDNSKINTIFFDFDNRARLSCPDRLHQATICVNNTEDLFIKYLEKIKNSNTEVLLINAWNEWGEKMHVEPSEQKGEYYLKLINKYL